MNRFLQILLLPLLVGLASCDTVVLDPSGDVAVQQRDLLVSSTLLMLLIIVPVILLTLLFAWRYRASNKSARFEPDWFHSIHLELVVWAVPLLIIVCLGAMTWLASHLLDPYRSIGRLGPGRPVTNAEHVLEIDVVSLDWKWLFIYPQYGIATVNDMALPIDRPIDFRITSATVMNSFFVPALAGQIYAMAGMETKLHAVLNKAGEYRGLSANYSGAGFSGMHFPVHGLSDADFAQWIASVKSDGSALDRETYIALSAPTENEPQHHYKIVEGSLYKAILTMCIKPGPMCKTEMQGMKMQDGVKDAENANSGHPNHDAAAGGPKSNP